MSIERQKVTVTLPKELLERLNEAVPGRKRSSFITAAIEEQLALTEQSSALAETAGSWLLENHPTMQDDAGIDGWLGNARQRWD